MFDIDVELRRGGFRRHVRLESAARVVAIVGPSGCGKTSLLHAVSGLSRPLRGHVAIAGERLFDAALGIDIPAYRRHIGYVFQDARLFPHLDVRRNLLFGVREARGEARFGFDAIVDLLSLAPLLARRTPSLSGGEAQRVALGRALLSQPSRLLLDEPLASLDAARRDELLPYLQRVRDESRLPMLYVSHAADEVTRIAQDVHVLD